MGTCSSSVPNYAAVQYNISEPATYPQGDVYGYDDDPDDPGLLVDHPYLYQDREGWQLCKAYHHPPGSSCWPLPTIQGHEDSVDGAGLDKRELGSGSQVQ